MAYDTLVLAQHDAVLTITVNRPEVLNAQSRIMREEFDAALAQAAEDDSIRVVIVAGAGQHFSAGHDIGSPQEREDRQRRPFAPGIVGEYKRNWDFNIANTLRWRDFPKPTIAQPQMMRNSATVRCAGTVRMCSTPACPGKSASARPRNICLQAIGLQQRRRCASAW